MAEMSTLIKNLTKQLRKEPAASASATIKKTFIDSSMSLHEKIRASSNDEIKFYKNYERKEAFYFPPINRSNDFMKSQFTSSNKFSRIEVERNKENLKNALNNGFLTEKSFSVSFERSPNPKIAVHFRLPWPFLTLRSRGIVPI